MNLPLQLEVTQADIDGAVIGNDSWCAISLALTRAGYLFPKADRALIRFSEDGINAQRWGFVTTTAARNFIRNFDKGKGKPRLLIFTQDDLAKGYPQDRTHQTVEKKIKVGKRLAEARINGTVPTRRGTIQDRRKRQPVA